KQSAGNITIKGISPAEGTVVKNGQITAAAVALDASNVPTVGKLTPEIKLKIANNTLTLEDLIALNNSGILCSSVDDSSLKLYWNEDVLSERDTAEPGTEGSTTALPATNITPVADTLSGN
ncbi:MAG: hypothetical protein Q7K42_05170, partial [Candidatus Diapherotrites archaeon]|nr:hypothetical protein [Candidatus Diapherotrites archaeon]